MSSTERTRKMRQRRRQDGLKRIEVWLDGETNEKLSRLAQGDSKDDIIKRLILEA